MSSDVGIGFAVGNTAAASGPRHPSRGNNPSERLMQEPQDFQPLLWCPRQHRAEFLTGQLDILTESGVRSQLFLILAFFLPQPESLVTYTPVRGEQLGSSRHKPTCTLKSWVGILYPGYPAESLWELLKTQCLSSTSRCSNLIGAQA